MFHVLITDLHASAMGQYQAVGTVYGHKQFASHMSGAGVSLFAHRSWIQVNLQSLQSRP
jgi:hypothetical protein